MFNDMVDPLANASPVESVFASPELLLLAVNQLVDVTSLPDFLSLCLVSKQFQEVLRSDEIWRELCRQRWKEKWGFVSRWERALCEFEEWKQIGENQGGLNGSFWRLRYVQEEQDSMRRTIAAHELKDLVFDFRFWIGQPTVVDERIVVQSGLRESASMAVRFEDTREEESSNNGWWSDQGVVTGHPLGSQEIIKWFLDEHKQIIQWGVVPNLWPQGMVRRLESWGWEISNPNVVMRAIDVAHEDRVMRHHTTCSSGKSRPKFHGLNLWKDFLDDIANVPLTNAPVVNGYPVTAELPRSLTEQFR